MLYSGPCVLNLEPEDVNMKAYAKLIEETRWALDDRRGHMVFTDVPEDLKGSNYAATPSELCLMSLVGCVGVTYRDIATNKDLDLKDMKVDSDAEKDSAGFHRIVVSTTVWADDEKKAERIYRNTQALCTIGKLFKAAGVEVSYEFEFVQT